MGTDQNSVPLFNQMYVYLFMQCSIVDALIIFAPGVFVLPRAFALYMLGIKLGTVQCKGPFSEGPLTSGLQPHRYP